MSAEKQESAEMKELREIRRLGQQAGEFPERKQNKIDGTGEVRGTAPSGQ